MPKPSLPSLFSTSATHSNTATGDEGDVPVLVRVRAWRGDATVNAASRPIHHDLFVAMLLWFGPVSAFSLFKIDDPLKRGHLGLGDAKPEDVSEDTVKAVTETLRTSTFVKASKDGKKLGRVTELEKPEEVIEQLDVRTIAASPLEYDVKLEDVELFFNKYAKVNSVRLPRHVADKRLFSGTALIEFSTEEDAANVLTQSLSYARVELELRPKCTKFLKYYMGFSSCGCFVTPWGFETLGRACDSSG
ncbi:unnamed protein product [Fraxinus pennsylvanica]|uniref:RRM domain-containing protein n=1 Tax=Fraxinus pennsylvanica TaxID=56036 RepID=A0AAD2A3Z6_9LAMI|nr:unnamed protein product [Fraxinus pennsylvanica]